MNSRNGAQRPKAKIILSRDWIKIDSLLLINVVLCATIQISTIFTYAQSIGYHPNLNLGFNPFLSPVFGYGLGFPYGAYNFSPSRNPLLADPLLGTNHMASNSLAGKLHTKTIMKKFAWNPLAVSPYYGSLKNKLFLLKHPEYAYAPESLYYGYGKHYGAATIPNNPYKSAYGDYYNTNDISVSQSSSSTSPNQHHSERDSLLHTASNAEYTIAKTQSIIKPLVKAGVLMTTAAILSKKALDHPMKLNPAGMILNNAQVYV